MIRKILTATAAAALMSVSAPALSAELITNGNFETGASGSAPVGWTVAPGTEILTIADTAYGTCCGATGLTGNQFAAFGAGQAPNISTLSQALGTIAGQSYAVSFLFGTFGSTAQALTVNVRSATTNAVIASFPFAPAAGGTNFANIFNPAGFSFAADGATTIEFSADVGTNDYDGLLDNVSVLGAVPEPATWGLMILGFGVIGGTLRSRRRQTARVSYN